LTTDKARAPARFLLLLAAANLLAWGWAWSAFASRPSLLATALLAWVFGLRHALDADHIAAIDNAVRKLMADGQRPLTTGLFFSLGHSSVVMLACAALALAAPVIGARFTAVRDITGVTGTAISAGFLLLIASTNLAILRTGWQRFRAARRGGASEPDNAALAGGPMTMMLRPLLRIVRRSWHMFPIGFLFGLGFDTATEVGLMGISATQGAEGLPAWQILIFPVLFTAGMTLVDSADSILMTGVYGWAGQQELRRLWYNLTITAASAVMALLIGGIEAAGLLAGKIGLEGGLWRAIAALNDNGTWLGVAIVAVFVGAWALSALVYRWKGYGRADCRLPVR
jgi:high-affinity nickel-transport protein